MIDKISGNSPYDYPAHNDAGKSPAVQAYEHTPGKREYVKQKPAGGRGSSGKAPDRGEKGVILDLSSRGKKAGTQAVQKPSLADALRRMVAPVIAWIKNFWESDVPSGAEAASGETADTGTAAADPAESAGPEDPELLQELPPLDEVSEIPDYQVVPEDVIRSGDLEQAEQILTQNGRRRPARHSDLLTYYDRRGNLVELDDTERHRVLFGDKNILKL